MNRNVQAAIAARLRPRMKRLGLSLDNTLEELRRLAYARPGEPFEDGEGELRPVRAWPKDSRQTALQLLTLKRDALVNVLKYLKHAGVYGQPEPSPVTNNQYNVTLVPIERLTDEELEFYRVLAEKGRAIPLEAKATANKAAETDAVRRPGDDAPRPTRRGVRGPLIWLSLVK